MKRRSSSPAHHKTSSAVAYASPAPFLAVTTMLRELHGSKEPYAMLLLEIACPGHPVSRIEDGLLERLMQLAAQRVIRVLGDCVVARLGANRIAVLLEGPIDENMALSMTGRFHDALRAAFEVAGQEFFVTTSIGIGLGHWSDEPATVLTHGERALERVKANGGDATAVEGRHLIVLRREQAA
jgi:GGDEF domain-containing protein